MNKLTATQLLMINKKLTGEDDIASPETQEVLEEIAAAPYEQDNRSLYIYRDITEKAAKLGCVLIQKRPFKYKNSQTALVSIFTFLELNNIKLTGYENDLFELITHLENNDISKSCSWITNHKVN